MAAPKRSELIAGAVQIEIETVAEANSAPRVGGYMKKLAKAIPNQWEATETYEAGERVYFNDAAYRALEFCDVGESPELAPTKWRSRQVNDQSLQTVTERGRITDRLLRAAGYEVPSFDDMAADDVEFVLVEKTTGDVKKIARMPVTALVAQPKAELELGELPKLTATVGKLFKETLPSGMVIDPDGGIVTYEADGPQPSGFTFAGPTRDLEGTPANTTTLTFPLLAKTPDGRTKKFTLSVPVQPAGVNRAINAVYAETNNGGSFSSYVFGVVGPGEKIKQTLKGKPGTASAGYTARVRYAATQAGGFQSFSGLFTGKADFASLWGDVNGVDDRPPFPSGSDTLVYILTTEAVGADNQPVTPAQFIEQEITFAANGVSKQVFPVGTLNLPPKDLDTFPATITLQPGGTYTENVHNFISDPEGDAFTSGIAGETTVRVVLDATTGAFTIYPDNWISTPGKVRFYAYDAQNRTAYTRTANVVFAQAQEFTVVRVDYRTTPKTSAVNTYNQEFRYLLTNIPAGQTPYFVSTLIYDGGQLAQSNYPLTAATGDWWNFVSTGEAFMGFSPTVYPNAKFRMSLVVGTKTVLLRELPLVQLDDVTEWTTIIGAVPPIAGVNPDLTSYTFTNAVKTTDANPGLLRVAATITPSGRVKLSNLSEPGYAGDRQRWYVVNGKEFRVDGPLANDTRTYPRGRPILIDFFLVPNGADFYNWRGQNLANAASSIIVN